MMLTMFFTSLSLSTAFLDAMGDGFRASSDGPFRVSIGEWRGVEARVYTIPGNADAAYAGVRMAVRRGARTAFVVSPVVALHSSLDRLNVEPGGFLTAGRVIDLSPLEAILPVIPDTAAEMPPEFAPLLKGVRQWPGSLGGPTIGTLPWSGRGRAMLKALRSEVSIDAVDRVLAGAALAGEEEGVEIRGLVYFSEVIHRGACEALPEAAIAKSFRQLGELFTTG